MRQEQAFYASDDFYTSCFPLQVTPHGCAEVYQEVTGGRACSFCSMLKFLLHDCFAPRAWRGFVDPMIEMNIHSLAIFVAERTKVISYEFACELRALNPLSNRVKHEWWESLLLHTEQGEQRPIFYYQDPLQDQMHPRQMCSWNRPDTPPATQQW